MVSDADREIPTLRQKVCVRNLANLISKTPHMPLGFTCPHQRPMRHSIYPLIDQHSLDILTYNTKALSSHAELSLGFWTSGTKAFFAKKWEPHHTKEYSFLQKWGVPAPKNRISELQISSKWHLNHVICSSIYMARGFSHKHKKKPPKKQQKTFIDIMCFLQ